MLSSARSPLGRAAFSRRRCGVGAPARAAQPARADAAASLHSVRAADDSLGAWILHAADKVLSVSEASPSWAPPTDAPLPAFTARALTSTDKSHLARCEFVAKMARKALGEEVHDEAPPGDAPPVPFLTFYKHTVKQVFMMPTDSHERVFASAAEATGWSARHIPAAHRRSLEQKLDTFVKALHGLHESKQTA